MEVSHVNKRLKIAMEQARARAQARRQRTAEAEQAYRGLSRDRSRRRSPGRWPTRSRWPASPSRWPRRAAALRLSADRGRDDFIEFVLDTSGDEPQVVGRVRVTRGSRTIDETLPVKAGTAPEDLTEEDVLDFLLRALEPWLER